MNPIYIFSTSLIYMFLFSQPQFVTEILALIAPREEAGEFFISANVAYKAFTSQYTYYSVAIVLPNLLFWAVLAPLLVFIPLYKAHIRKPDVKFITPAEFFEREQNG